MQLRSGFQRSNDKATGAPAPPSVLQEKIAEANRLASGPPSVPVDKKVPVTVEVDGKTLVEREAAELFKFETPGDFIKGILTGAEVITIRGKRCFQYTIDDVKENRIVKILGTWDLNQKIRPADVGSFLQIVFKGEDKNIKKGDNCMKMFAVAFEQKSKSAEFSDGSKITDEDIPF